MSINLYILIKAQNLNINTIDRKLFNAESILLISIESGKGELVDVQMALYASINRETYISKTLPKKRLIRLLKKNLTIHHFTVWEYRIPPAVPILYPCT